MKKNSKILFGSFLSLSLVLAACGSGGEGAAKETNNNNTKANPIVPYIEGIPVAPSSPDPNPPNCIPM